MRLSDFRQLPLTIAFWTLFGCGQPPDLTPSLENSAAPATAGSGLTLVTLSPHLAELVFAVGAGEMLIGVSAHTDYPAAAASLPVIGDAFALDQERLTILQPDVLLAWDTGTPAHVIDDLIARGFRVEVVETTGLYDVGAALRKIGALTGYAKNAARVAAAFDSGMRRLADEHVDAASIKVFYQVARRPLYTVSSTHYISDIIELCGGRNVFAELGNLAPMISVEAVLERDPEVLLASEDAGADAFDDWEQWVDLAANRFANKFVIPADEIGRATPRLLVAATAICNALTEGRNNRESTI